MKIFTTIALFASLLALPKLAHSQINGSSYDDFGSFASDPVDLDREYKDMFGRFFQANLSGGTGILSGGLGSAFPAGLAMNARFIYYFDQVWAGELGFGYGRHAGSYVQANTGINALDVQEIMTLIPISLGLRFGFNRDLLARSIATMNPYLALNGVLYYRSQAVQGTPVTTGLGTDLETKLVQNTVLTDTAFGVSFGGGVEFDVYKEKVYLGLDLRYHLIFWPDSSVLYGTLDRTGNYVSILGGVTYNY